MKPCLTCQNLGAFANHALGDDRAAFYRAIRDSKAAHRRGEHKGAGR
jgi:hypothetical protein